MSKYTELKKVSVERLLETYQLEYSLSGTLRVLGVSEKDSRARTFVRDCIKTHKPILLKQRITKNSYTIEDVKNAVKNSICFSDVTKLLGLAIHGGNNATLHRIIERENINISHFNQKEAFQRGKRKLTYEEIFCKHSKVAKSRLNNLAKRFDIFPYGCTECGNTGTHNGKILSLQLDHRSGISNDNRIENLRWLCPNCHTQTINYAGKGKRKKITPSSMETGWG